MSKKHHVVPQFILRNFSAIQGRDQVHVLDKKTGMQFISSVKNAGCINHYNTFDRDGEVFNYEEQFSDIDSRSACIVRRLLGGEPVSGLSFEEIKVLCLMTAVQIARSKVYRGTPGRIVSSLAAKTREWFGVAVDIPELDESRMGFRALDSVPYMAALLLGKDIFLIRLPVEEPLWISDNPVVLSNGDPYGDIGLACKGIEIYFPLAPDVCLAFVCKSWSERVVRSSGENSYLLSEALRRNLRSQSVLQGSTAAAQSLREMQVNNSWRFIYASVPDFSSAHRLLEEHPDLSEVTSMVTVGALPGWNSAHGERPKGHHVVLTGAKSSHCLTALSGVVKVGGSIETVVERGVNLQAALSDGPFEECRIFEDGDLRELMREVEVIVQSSGKGSAKIRIQHSDPSFAALMASLDAEHVS